MAKQHRGAAYQEYRPYKIIRRDGLRLKDWTVLPLVWDERGYPFSSYDDAANVIKGHFVGMATARGRGIRIVRPA